ncbi:MAG: hypothetical protein KKB50_12815 [Planctomycetes bacterium]|nr:hypothetical protein [Planctomycetota bacterium]
MTAHLPTGWNTWDFRGFNRLTYLRRGRPLVSLLYAIWQPTDDPKGCTLHDTFRWDSVRSLGPHAPLGLPARLDFVVADVPYRATAVAEKETLHLSVAPLAETDQRVVFVFLLPEGEAPMVDTPTTGRFAGGRISLERATWPSDYFLNIPHSFALGAPGQIATLTLDPAAQRRTTTTLPAPADSTTLAAALTSYDQQSLSGDGALADAPQAMLRAIAWNTLYDQRRKLVLSPVSRDWCYDWRGPIAFCWDTFFVALMASYEEPELARANFMAVTEPIDRLGFVPNYVMSHGAVSLDRSMPPLGAYIAWKLELLRPDRTWLARVYPRLRKWHQFWMANRDGNGDGLLEWGSNADPAYEFPQLLPFNPAIQHAAICAKYESGLDNSPMYDDAVFNKQTNTFELTDVGLNCYYALDCEALAALATLLDKPRHAAAYQREYETIRERVNAALWDERNGLYANRHWDGRFSARWSPTSFFPLLAGLAPSERAERLVRAHLLNNDEFWGRYVIPAIARCDPAFPDNDYWRGRIWGPFNFLVAEGLRRYRYDREAADLAQRGLQMFLQNWHADGGIYENYNATTGAGGDVWNAARLYHWGGLMAFIAIQELIDVEATGYLRLGSLHFPAAGVRNAWVGRMRYDVRLGEDLLVRRDDQPYLAAAPRALVRIPLDSRAPEPLQISAPAAGTVVLHNPQHAPRAACLNRTVHLSAALTPAGHTYTWTAAQAAR